jgi:transposase
MTTKTRPELKSVREPRLFVAFELGATNWTLAMTSGLGQAVWVRTVRAGDLAKVTQLLTQGRQQCGLPATAPVVSCYEAGRDGFWVHRALEAAGVRNCVVDSASIEVNRRARRVKTDRIDALKLVMMLVRARSGEQRVWREVHVPPVVAEAARHVNRERSDLIAERTRLTNQIGSWLATYGCRRPRRADSQWWTTVRDWADAPLPPELHARIARAEARLVVLATQLAELGAQQRAAAAAAPADSALHRLVRLKGVAAAGAGVLLGEGLAWRQFENRRQVGGLLGFTPMPYQSGDQARDQGIDRAGNSRWRSVSIQLAWGWLRWQRSSALAQWYEERFGSRGARARRIGIVALARKLMIALWRWACHGVVPTGAVLKEA